MLNKNKLLTNASNNKSQFIKIHTHHHAIISNYLVLETSIRHVIILQNIYYKKNLPNMVVLVYTYKKFATLHSH